MEFCLLLYLFVCTCGGGGMCVPVCCAHVQRPKRPWGVSVSVGLFRRGRCLSLNPRPVLSQLRWKFPSPGDLSISASLETGGHSSYGEASVTWGWNLVLMVSERCSLTGPPLSSPCQGFSLDCWLLGCRKTTCSYMEVVSCSLAALAAAFPGDFRLLFTLGYVICK